MVYLAAAIAAFGVFVIGYGVHKARCGTRRRGTVLAVLGAVIVAGAVGVYLLDRVKSRMEEQYRLEAGEPPVVPYPDD